MGFINDAMDSDWAWAFPLAKGLHEAGKAAGVGPLDLSGVTGGGGGGGKGNKPLNTPDFFGAAEKQGEASRQAVDAQTQANRPDQTNAFGAQTRWTRNPDGSWSQTQSLGGPLGGAASSLEAQAATNAGTPLDNGSAVRQQAIDATYGQEASRLDPQWAQREAATRSNLSATGAEPGTEAYNREMGDFSRSRNDAYDSAMRNAISTGNEAQALTFGQNMAAREAPLNELGALRGFTEMPHFASAGQAQPTQYLPAAGMESGAALSKYATDNAGKNSKMGGAASLAPLMFGSGGAFGGGGAGAGAGAGAGVLI